jgi:hypothetical protein
LMDRLQLDEYHIRFPWHVKQVSVAGSDLSVFYIPVSRSRWTLRNFCRGLVSRSGARRLPIVHSAQN